MNFSCEQNLDIFAYTFGSPSTYGLWVIDAHTDKHANIDSFVDAVKEYTTPLTAFRILFLFYA